MANLLRSIVENDKGELRKLEKTAKKVESYADAMSALSDEKLQAKTPEFKERYQDGESLDVIPFSETDKYVTKVKKNYEQYKRLYSKEGRK